MMFLKSAAAFFGWVALIAFGHAGVIAWSGDIDAIYGPLIAAAIFGVPAFFMSMIVFMPDMPGGYPMPPPMPPEFYRKM